MHRSQFRLLPDNWKSWYKQYVPSSPSIRFVKALWNFVEISCWSPWKPQFHSLQNLSKLPGSFSRSESIFHAALRSGMRLLNKKNKHYSGSALGHGSCWCISKQVARESVTAKFPSRDWKCIGSCKYHNLLQSEEWVGRLFFRSRNL